MKLFQREVEFGKYSAAGLLEHIVVVEPGVEDVGDLQRYTVSVKKAVGRCDVGAVLVWDPCF